MVPNVDQRKGKREWNLDHLDLGTSSKIGEAISKPRRVRNILKVRSFAAWRGLKREGKT